MALQTNLNEQVQRPSHTGHQHPAKMSLETAMQDGRAFVVSDRVTDLSQGDSHFLFLEAGGNKVLHVYLVVEATGDADLDVSFDATEDTQGSDAGINNLKAGSERTADFSARRTETGETGAYTHGTTVISNVVPGGVSEAILGARFGAPSFTIDQGNNKLFEVTNRASGNERFAYDVMVVELD